MKNIKKIIVGVLSAIFLLACCGCREKVDKYGFLSEKALLENEIPDLPELPHGKEENTYTISRYFFCTLSYEEFQAYVEEVFEYLVSLDFEYFGHQKNIDGIGSSDTFIAGEKLSDFYLDNQKYGYQIYQFIWADEIWINDNTKSKSLYQRKGLEISYYYEAQTWEVDKTDKIFQTFNVLIRLNEVPSVLIVEDL